jgi:predicted Zn-dependent protease
MRWAFAALVLCASGIAGGQPLLECRADFAFAPEAVDSFAKRAYEQRLDAYGADGRLERDPALLARLRRLTASLREAADEERSYAAGVHWQVHTCRRCGENASAMAGGRLLLGEEFLSQLAPTDDELGYLLAHEMAHVLCEHTREFATVARYFADNGLHRDYRDLQQELDGSLPLQFRMEFMGEQQELEADRVGFFLGARAGFDPTAMARLLGKLEPAGSSSAMPSMHPSARKRLDQAASMLQAAREVGAQAEREHWLGGP